jgi:hypothetical protein
METAEGGVDMMCSTSYTPKSRFAELVMAVLDKRWEDCPDEIDTDRLIGCKLRAFVEHNETDKGTWAKVTKTKSADLFADA